MALYFSWLRKSVLEQSIIYPYVSDKKAARQII